MSDYLKGNVIKEKKILIVHMFRERMVQDKKAVKKYENSYLVMNLDGHGISKVKKVDI